MSSITPPSQPMPKGHATSADATPSGEKVSLPKAEFNALRAAVAQFCEEYADLLDTARDTQDWRDKAIGLVIRHRETRDGNPVSPLRQFEMMAGLTAFVARRVHQQRFTFHLPNRLGLLPELERNDLLDLSERLKTLGRVLDGMSTQLEGWADQLGPSERERLHTLMQSISSLFKSLLRQDWDDVQVFISHLNLVTTSRDSQDLVEQIAKIAREIYNSLNEISEDFSMDTLSQTTEEIPDAVKKLKWVILRLEEAANANLDHLERLGREVNEHQQYVDEAQKILRECHGEMANLQAQHPDTAEDFARLTRSLNQEVAPHLEKLAQNVATNEEAIMGMMANQGFQDLTGQTLKKVIEFVETLQFQLVDLLKKYTKSYAPAGEGPAADATRPAPVTQSQDDVDKLLANLGF